MYVPLVFPRLLALILVMGRWICRITLGDKRAEKCRFCWSEELGTSTTAIHRLCNFNKHRPTWFPSFPCQLDPLDAGDVSCDLRRTLKTAKMEAAPAGNIFQKLETNMMANIVPPSNPRAKVWPYFETRYCCCDPRKTCLKCAFREARIRFSSSPEK